MILIDGKKAAAELREDLKQEVLELKEKYNKVPGLTVILIGELAPSKIYVKNKEKSANEVGLKSEVIRYPDDVEEKTILEKIWCLKFYIWIQKLMRVILFQKNQKLILQTSFVMIIYSIWLSVINRTFGKN